MALCRMCKKREAFDDLYCVFCEDQLWDARCEAEVARKEMEAREEGWEEEKGDEYGI